MWEIVVIAIIGIFVHKWMKKHNKEFTRAFLISENRCPKCQGLIYKRKIYSVQDQFDIMGGSCAPEDCEHSFIYECVDCDYLVTTSEKESADKEMSW